MRTEKISASIFLIGLLFKYMHWPGGSILVVLSLTTIAMLYFPFGFYFFSDKSIKTQNRKLSIVSGLFLAMVPIGIMFKIQFWPGSQMNLLMGWAASIAILAIVIFLKNKSEQDLMNYYNNMIKRLSVIIIVGGIFYFTSAETILKIYFRDINDPELLRVKTNYLLHPENEEYQKEHDEYMRKMDSIQFQF